MLTVLLEYKTSKSTFYLAMHVSENHNCCTVVARLCPCAGLYGSRS